MINSLPVGYNIRLSSYIESLHIGLDIQESGWYHTLINCLAAQKQINNWEHERCIEVSYLASVSRLYILYVPKWINPKLHFMPPNYWG